MIIFPWGYIITRHPTPLSVNKKMLLFLIFNMTFDVQTGTSDFQLEGVVLQEQKPVVLSLRKLMHNQKGHTKN